MQAMFMHTSDRSEWWITTITHVAPSTSSLEMVEIGRALLPVTWISRIGEPTCNVVTNLVFPACLQRLRHTQSKPMLYACARLGFRVRVSGLCYNAGKSRTFVMKCVVPSRMLAQHLQPSLASARRTGESLHQQSLCCRTASVGLLVEHTRLH